MLCHETWLARAMRELTSASELLARLQSGKSAIPPKQRTLGERIIGSMWNPRDGDERDDIAATYRSIERFLHISI